MDNSSYRSQFIQSYIEDSNFSESSFQAINAFWNRVAKAESEIGKQLESGYSVDDYINLIAKLNVASVYVLLPTKSRIGKYLKWLQDREVLDPQYVDNLYSISYESIKPDSVYENKYFKDFGSLQEAITDTLWAAEKVDDNVFAIQITALYLAWCGLSIEEALQLKKVDVEEDTIKVGDKLIHPTSTIMEYIKDYRDATEYQSQAKGIITLKYVDTDKLLRTARSDSILPKAMRIFIRNFGKSADESINIFTYDKVYWSGIFNRAYIYECANGVIKPGEIEKMEMLFNEHYPSTFVANKRLREYQSFKRYFFPTSKSTSENDT